MEKKTAIILEWVKNGQLSVDEAQRQLLVLFGFRKNACCKLDRLQNECCIFQHTSLKECKECGHFIK